MKTLTSLFVASLPVVASAKPTLADLHDKIARTYHPQIEARHQGLAWSLYGCRIEKFQLIGQDPVTLLPRFVNVSIYRSPWTTENQNAVIILPPTGGVNILDRGYANELCISGTTAALISDWEHQPVTSLDYSMHNDGALRSLAATRHVVEFLKSRNYGSIGLLGTSIGAIAGALAFGIEERISATALIVGSARFADVVAESDETGANLLRTNRMTAYGYKDQEEYTKAVRENIEFEPTDFLQNINDRKSLIVSADADTTVPSPYQFELAQLLKSESHIRLRGNHLQAIRDAFIFHRGTIARFFTQALARTN